MKRNNCCFSFFFDALLQPQRCLILAPFKPITLRGLPAFVFGLGIFKRLQLHVWTCGCINFGECVSRNIPLWYPFVTLVDILLFFFFCRCFCGSVYIYTIGELYAIHKDMKEKHTNVMFIGYGIKLHGINSTPTSDMPYECIYVCVSVGMFNSICQIWQTLCNKNAEILFSLFRPVALF